MSKRFDIVKVFIDFEEMCKKAETGDDILKIAANYTMIFNKNLPPQFIYNQYIGYALPEKETCEIIVNTWKQFPNKKLVDFGAGYGAFCKVFNHLGIPAEKLLAVDLIKSSHCIEKNDYFWPIHRDNNYIIDIDDILFIAWGTKMDHILEDYITRGGSCVIILGEMTGGCTFPSDIFLDEKTRESRVGWNVVLHEVNGPVSYCSERLSINIKL
jgi:hypothetical protein